MDADVERYLKLLTLLDFDKIQGISQIHIQNPAIRYGQKQLANYVVTTIYGEKASQQAQKITEILFSDDKMEVIKSLDKEESEAVLKEVGGVQLSVKSGDTKIIDISTQTGLTDSNGDAKKCIQSGSLFCNEQKVTDPNKSSPAKTS